MATAPGFGITVAAGFYDPVADLRFLLLIGLEMNGR